MSDKDSKKPTRHEAEEAVRVLLSWAGDDIGREGLVDTPKRVVRAYEEWFSGYDEDPYEFLSRTFREVNGYDEIVALTNIDFNSHCEHHIAPIIGQGARGLPAARQGGWHQQAGAGGGRLRAAPAGAGESLPPRLPSAFQPSLSRAAWR